MKKRVLSMLMALVLCLTLLPTAALADELGPVDGTSTVEAEAKAKAGAEAVAAVQAMIDALPDALTEENAGDVSAMLGKIDAAMGCTRGRRTRRAGSDAVSGGDRGVGGTRCGAGGDRAVCG